MPALVSLFAGAAPAATQDRWNWSPGAYRFMGAGVPLLCPELCGSPRGRAFVMRNFDVNRDGRIQPRIADSAKPRLDIGEVRTAEGKICLYIAYDRTSRFTCPAQVHRRIHRTLHGHLFAMRCQTTVSSTG